MGRPVEREIHKVRHPQTPHPSSAYIPSLNSPATTTTMCFTYNRVPPTTRARDGRRQRQRRRTQQRQRVGRRAFRARGAGTTANPSTSDGEHDSCHPSSSRAQTGCDIDVMGSAVGRAGVHPIPVSPAYHGANFHQARHDGPNASAGALG